MLHFTGTVSVWFAILKMLHNSADPVKLDGKRLIRLELGASRVASDDGSAVWYTRPKQMETMIMETVLKPEEEED
ncbi:hypothetical protein AAP_04683 [Ascosphaera apis ARSEF 7405]|uniref:Uncharacterized protein n=1 Tax=Ascosphaera apis ARSEF 7405 TaxID=392613 RepID=A0A167WIH5_9EURO|nr:hypothetical protein AAP_04683 [Ascosphaera apis ARSEF 7405]